MRRLVMSRLIWIYTFFHSVLDFWLNFLFAQMDVSKFGDGSVQLRNSGMNKLSCPNIKVEYGKMR